MLPISGNVGAKSFLFAPWTSPMLMESDKTMKKETKKRKRREAIFFSDVVGAKKQSEQGLIYGGGEVTQQGSLDFYSPPWSLDFKR